MNRREQMPSTRAALEKAAEELNEQAAVKQIELEQGNYVTTYEDGGRRFYYSFDKISGKNERVYLADGEEPPKEGDPNEY